MKNQYFILARKCLFEIFREYLLTFKKYMGLACAKWGCQFQIPSVQNQTRKNICEKWAIFTPKNKGTYNYTSFTL